MAGNRLKLLTIPLDRLGVEESPMAYRINSVSAWLPKSQIQDWEIKDDKVTLWLPEWLIIDKTLEAFIDTSYEPSLF